MDYSIISMRMAMVGLLMASLALPLHGCQSQPHGEFDHVLAQSVMTASTQAAVYAITKDNPELVQTWDTVLQALDEVQAPTDEYWEIGREMIINRVHPAYAAGALLIYGVAETQLKHRFPIIDNVVDNEEFLRYIDAVKIGVKTGMLLAKPNA